MNKTIGIFTGSRGEWGYLRPIIAELKRLRINYKLIVTNMHLLAEKGFSYREIENDGFKISEKIFININGPEEISWPKSLGLLALQLPDIFSKLNLDILLIAGDRAETLTAAKSAYYSDIPVAHIQAGELSGHKDGMARHAIGKLSHIHFASNHDAAIRLKRFGEQNFRIHLVGAPQLDDITPSKIYKKSKIEDILGIKLLKKYALCIVHPTSENILECKKYVEWINEILIKAGIQQVWIYPNNDIGSKEIVSQIDMIKKNDTLSFRNLNRSIFLSLLKNSEFLIGNSSSGILEAPTLKKISINIGVRQHDRLRAKSVIDISNVSKNKIMNAVNSVGKKAIKDKLRNLKNPYGDGKSAKRIVNILLREKLDMNLRNKTIQE